MILTPHWVFAGVLEYYGRGRDGPPVVSPHNAYAFWTAEAGRVITVAIGPEVAARHFREVRQIGFFACHYCVMWRPDTPILLATGAERPLRELLERWRTYSFAGVPALVH